MIKLYKKDHTDKTKTVWQWICENSDQINLQNKVLSKTDIQKYPAILEFNHKFDLDRLSKDIEKAKKEYGNWGWLSEKDPKGEKKPYSGFSLTWNPNHIEGILEHQSVLGSPGRSSFTYDIGKPMKAVDSERKDDYIDTLGFNERTKASKLGSIGELIDKNVKRTLIKSRISTIDGTQEGMGPKRPFHRDANIFIGTRVNIPIKTDKPYVFDIKSMPEPTHLKLGKAYSFDTSTLHRVITMRPCNNQRTHIVINVSPWWDWNQEEQCWQTNEFYGEMHPFEMLYNGHIMSGLHA